MLFRSGAGAAGAAAAGAGAAGAGAGAGAGAAALGATIAPSQPTAAVAGVQLELRQQSSLVPFFQISSLVPLRQLSMVWAPAAVASAAVAISIATLFNFIIFVLLWKAAAALRLMGRSR